MAIKFGRTFIEDIENPDGPVENPYVSAVMDRWFPSKRSLTVPETYYKPGDYRLSDLLSGQTRTPQSNLSAIITPEIQRPGTPVNVTVSEVKVPVLPGDRDMKYGTLNDSEKKSLYSSLAGLSKNIKNEMPHEDRKKIAAETAQLLMQDPENKIIVDTIGKKIAQWESGNDPYANNNGKDSRGRYIYSKMPSDITEAESLIANMLGVNFGKPTIFDSTPDRTGMSKMKLYDFLSVKQVAEGLSKAKMTDKGYITYLADQPTRLTFANGKYQMTPDFMRLAVNRLSNQSSEYSSKGAIDRNFLIENLPFNETVQDLLFASTVKSYKGYNRLLNTEEGSKEFNTALTDFMDNISGQFISITPTKYSELKNEVVNAVRLIKANS